MAKTFDDLPSHFQLKRARIDCGLTAREVFEEMRAVGSQVNQSALARYENGGRTPSDRMYQEWGEALARLAYRRRLLTENAIKELAAVGFRANSVFGPVKGPSTRGRNERVR
jgi:transcriptional regulator with XRE-family HTH domain